MYATKKLDDTYEKQVTIKEMEIKGGYLVNNPIFERHLVKLFKKWSLYCTSAFAKKATLAARLSPVSSCSHITIVFQVPQANISDLFLFNFFPPK